MRKLLQCQIWQVVQVAMIVLAQLKNTTDTHIRPCALNVLPQMPRDIKVELRIKSLTQGGKFTVDVG